MYLRQRQLIGIAALFIAFSTQVFGEQGVVIRREDPPSSGREIERSAVSFSAPWRPNGGGGDTKIIGTVIDIRQVPVARARVQIRNLETGNVEQQADANDAGEYQFVLDDPGTYVVEMVMVDGAVIALSNAGALSRYETMQTVLQLPGRWDDVGRRLIVDQNVTSFLGMSAKTTMAAATIEVAVDNNITPRDPGVAVSPF